MKIMVSACLLGENCKYNGGNNRNEKVLAFVREHDVISVCPEVMGGLPTPRIPSEICQGIVINKEGVSVDRDPLGFLSQGMVPGPAASASPC